jgi:hypothetical protein
MAGAKIIPTAGQVAHQALLTLAVTVTVLAILSTVPGLRAWVKKQADGMPGA